jgi:NADPH:quinone reductase-like Zn-dependent oxidoreductase
VKALVCRKNGRPRVFPRLEEVEKPVPNDDQVLVQVCASSVTYNNLILVSPKLFPIRLVFGRTVGLNEQIPGNDMAGRVEAVGRNVTQLKPGDEVFGDLFGYGKGAYAEYVCAPEDALALKPVNLLFEEAAAVPEAAMVALHGLRDTGRIQPGQKVLIYSASGGIGTFAVQIAKYYGAEVTAVCSTRNLEMVRSLGADHVIDYTKEDFTKNGQQYDLILAVRKSRSVFAIKRALRPKGIYVSTASGSPVRLYQEAVVGPGNYRKDGKEIAIISGKANQKDLVFIKELIEAGKVRPVIDRRYPLSEVLEAFRYYAKGHARGKVVITMEQGGMA